MTRLENQLTEMRNELARFEAFAHSANQRFLNHLLNDIAPALKKYGVKVAEPAKNTCIDRGVFDKAELYYRVYLAVDLNALSDLQRKRITEKLREAKVPIMIGGVLKTGISLVYRNN